MAGHLFCPEPPYLSRCGVSRRLFDSRSCYNLLMDKRNQLHTFFLPIANRLCGAGKASNTYFFMKKLFHVLKALVCVSLVSYCGTAQAQDFGRTRFFEFQFQTLSFENFGESGFYGFGTSITSIGDGFGRSHIGFDFHTSANYGLSDFAKGVLFEIGPSYRYDLGEHFFLNVPVDCMYALLSHGEQDMNSWMMKVAPTLYMGGKVRLFVGPQWCYNFTGSDSTFGLRVGLAFGFGD